MIYLDYSATTPVNKEVLSSFNKSCIDYPGNANSLHKLGRESFHLMEAATKQVANLMKVDSSEVIFTSGATESNNLALIGTVLKYKNRGNHILTTKLEHSSILETIDYLESNGFIVEYLNILENGKVDLDDLKNKIRDDTVLVSINHVNSEIGIIQDVESIGKILKKYPKIIFHVGSRRAPTNSTSIVPDFTCAVPKFLNTLRRAFRPIFFFSSFATSMPLPTTTTSMSFDGRSRKMSRTKPPTT